jgi:hypothetical protein
VAARDESDDCDQGRLGAKGCVTLNLDPSSCAASIDDQIQTGSGQKDSIPKTQRDLRGSFQLEAGKL